MLSESRHTWCRGLGMLHAYSGIDGLIRFNTFHLVTSWASESMRRRGNLLIPGRALLDEYQ